MKKKKVYLNIYEYACERREIDTKKIHMFLLKNNYKLVNKPGQAEIIIFISCGIIEKNTEACLSYIKFYKQFGSKLFVGGCGPGIDKDRISEVHQGPVFMTKDLNELDNLFPNEKYPFSEIEEATSRYSSLDKGLYKNCIVKIIRTIPGLNTIFHLFQKIILLNFYGRYSFIYLKAIGLPREFYIKIADGCLGKCSYCALPSAIGKLKSKAPADCLQEFQKGLNQKYRNFYLTADDSGAYGFDIGTNIYGLLQKLISLPGRYNILISSLNPVWLVKYIDDLESLVVSKRIKSIVVPIQSANQDILEKMGRSTNIKKTQNAILRLKKADPNLWISTHIIVGFPSESKEALDETLAMVSETPFDEIQVFAFSIKPGTPAELIQPEISFEEISKRMNMAYHFFKKQRYRCYKYKNDFVYAAKPRQSYWLKKA